MAEFPYPENTSTFTSLMYHADELTNHFLGIGILIAVFVVALISSKSGSLDKSLGFAGFLTFVAALFLRFLSLITNTVLYVVIVMMIGIIIYMWFLREQESP